MSRPVEGRRPSSRQDGALDRITARVADRIGASTFERYFGQQARLGYESGTLRVSVASGFMASLLGRRFGAILQEATASEAGGASCVDFRVEAERFSPGAGTDRARGAHRTSAPGRDVPGAGRVASHRRPRAAPGARRYRLDDFVVGQANRLAYTAALRMAESDEGDLSGLSPLFIHGRCGLGKTHLLQGLAERFRRLHPGATVRYTTGEAFTNEFLAALREHRMDAFRRKFRRVDLLCLDDVHFLARKHGTQKELMHTFDAIDLGGARIVLASDEHPSGIEDFNRKLSSRFLAGLVAELEDPDQSLREQIVRVLALRRGLLIDDSGVRAIASRAVETPEGRASVRDLEGLITRVEAVAGLLLSERPGPITALVVDSALGPALPAGPSRPIPLSVVVEHTCRVLGVEASEVMGRGRHRRVVLSRGMIANLARELTTLSFPEIARGLGRPGHSTVITAHQRLEKQMAAHEPGGVDGSLAGLTVNQIRDRIRRAVLATTAVR